MLSVKEVDWNKLKVFYFVSKHHSFKAAAASIGITQPCISRTIQQLEEQLNCKLFNCSAKGSELTEAGGKLLDTLKYSTFRMQVGLCQLKELGSTAVSNQETLTVH